MSRYSFLILYHRLRSVTVSPAQHTHPHQLQSQIHPYTPQHLHKIRSTLHDMTTYRPIPRTTHNRSPGRRTISRSPDSGRSLIDPISKRPKCHIQVPTARPARGLLNQATPHLGRQHKTKHHSHMIVQYRLSAVHTSNISLNPMVVAPRSLGIIIKNCLHQVPLHIHHHLFPSPKIDGKTPIRDDEIRCRLF